MSGIIVTLKSQLFQVTSEKDDALEKIQDLTTHKGQKVAGSGEGQSGGLAGDQDADRGRDEEAQGAVMGQGNDRRVEVRVG